mmetsp:Transcript_19462/g.46040  ORF Transcript_19462/g.46040 Transcript_19462/m.46040 type:complete len:313 (+) Transcript_19462:300-1238(+)
MIVQAPPAGVEGDCPLVDDGLAVILARRLQLVQLEQSIRGRVELQVVMSRLVDGGLHIVVLDGDWCILHEAGIGEAAALGQVLEIVPVQRTRQTFAPQNLVVAQGLRHAAVGVHVGEVQFASGLEEAAAALQHGLLVGAEVNDAVGHDDVDGIVGEGIDLIQLLDLAQMELDVVVSKLLGVVRLRLLGDGQLLRRHVDADDPAGRSHQLRRNVHVSAGSASQIQHGRALQQVRDAQPAAVVLGHDVGVDGADGGFNMGWHRRRSAAGIGFEVVGRRQRLAVVVRDGVLDLAGLLRTAGGRGVDEEVAGHGEA